MQPLRDNPHAILLRQSLPVHLQPRLFYLHHRQCALALLLEPVLQEVGQFRIQLGYSSLPLPCPTVVLVEVVVVQTLLKLVLSPLSLAHLHMIVRGANGVVAQRRLHDHDGHGPVVTAESTVELASNHYV